MNDISKDYHQLIAEGVVQVSVTLLYGEVGIAHISCRRPGICTIVEATNCSWISLNSFLVCHRIHYLTLDHLKDTMPQHYNESMSEAKLAIIFEGEHQTGVVACSKIEVFELNGVEEEEWKRSSVDLLNILQKQYEKVLNK
jgi:hypothetical protein